MPSAKSTLSNFHDTKIHSVCVYVRVVILCVCVCVCVCGVFASLKLGGK